MKDFELFLRFLLSWVGSIIFCMCSIYMYGVPVLLIILWKYFKPEKVMTEQFYPEDYFDENPDPQDKDPKEPGNGHFITMLVLFVVLLSIALYIVLINLDKNN